MSVSLHEDEAETQGEKHKGVRREGLVNGDPRNSATFTWVMRPSEQLSEVKFWSIVPYPSMSQCCQRGTDGITKNTTLLFDPAGLAKRSGVQSSYYAACAYEMSTSESQS